MPSNCERADSYAVVDEGVDPRLMSGQILMSGIGAGEQARRQRPVTGRSGRRRAMVSKSKIHGHAVILIEHSWFIRLWNGGLLFARQPSLLPPTTFRAGQEPS